MSFYGGYTGLGAMYAGANYEEGHALHCAWGAGADCTCGKDLWSDAAPARETLSEELETADATLEDETFDWDDLSNEVTPLPIELWDNDGDYLDTTGLLDEVHNALIFDMDRELYTSDNEWSVAALPAGLESEATWEQGIIDQALKDLKRTYGQGWYLLGTTHREGLLAWKVVATIATQTIPDDASDAELAESFREVRNLCKLATRQNLED